MFVNVKVYILSYSGSDGVTFFKKNLIFWWKCANMYNISYKTYNYFAL